MAHSFPRGPLVFMLNVAAGNVNVYNKFLVYHFTCSYHQLAQEVYVLYLFTFDLLYFFCPENCTSLKYLLCAGMHYTVHNTQYQFDTGTTYTS